jgi:hypothetical protein
MVIKGKKSKCLEGFRQRSVLSPMLDYHILRYNYMRTEWGHLREGISEGGYSR